MDAKRKIILATLDIIKTGGMRAIRHRAVAAKAQVSLGSTTYHFKDIEDLITSAFIYWHEQADIDKNPYYQSLTQSISVDNTDALSSAELTDILISYGEQYLYDQIFVRTDDRLIELAFHNEALRSDKLSGLMLVSWQEEVARLTNLFAGLSVPNAEFAGESTFALFMQLEKKALLVKDPQAQKDEWQKMKLVFAQHVRLIVG